MIKTPHGFVDILYTSKDAFDGAPITTNVLFIKAPDNKEAIEIAKTFRNNPIRDVPENTVVGTAIRSVKDTFNRKVGRKVALTKALSQTNLSKKQRREVWDSFFQHCDY